mgnify:CR=1 FL=1
MKSQQKGEIYAISLTVIEAWFPIFAFFTVQALGALHAYFYSLLVTILCLSIWWFIRGKQHEIKVTAAYKNLTLTTFFITLLFSLTFMALQYTSVTNVAIILFLQILFSYVFLGKRQEESLNSKQAVGALLMTVGAVLILFPGAFVINVGDVLVLLAAMIAPIANLYQKKARAQVSSETILLLRSIIALPFIYVLATLFEQSPSVEMIKQQWIWLVLTGGLVFFIAKLFWVEAIHLLPITKVNALFAIAPLMTMFLAYWLLNQIPTLYQLMGIAPILIGGYLITRKN